MFQTPQKAMQFVAEAMNLGTPQNRPSSAVETPKSLAFRGASNFSLLPVMETPPSRFPRVVNPFEHGLAERLHLPLICSPSLFHRPSTPQHSSTQFEWTIEEVSSLGPANVEPHETQFQESPDPVLEAKAQAAISSYFKDQIIAPSPAECPLRKHKIDLNNIMNCNSPPVRSGRRIRDSSAQTVMTIPPVVPPEVEEMLKQFLTYNVDQQQSPTVSCDITIDYEAQDISLRRKLFVVPTFMNKDADEEERNFDLDISEISSVHSPPPKSPDLKTDEIPLRGFGAPFGDNSFGELSPISKIDSKRRSPKRRSPKRPSEDDTLNNTADPVDEDYNFGNVSNIFKSTQQSPENPINLQSKSLFRSTPDRSASSNVIDMSVDSSLIRNITRRSTGLGSKILFPCDAEGAAERSFAALEEDGMQISQLSAKSTSSSSSSQHSDTPVRRRSRSVSRKNLSRSFSCPVTDDEDDADTSQLFVLKKQAVVESKSSPEMREQYCQTPVSVGGDKATLVVTERSVFYRADSGFNEPTHDESKFHNEMDDVKRNVGLYDTDVSMRS